jgi:hypothetical protein
VKDRINVYFFVLIQVHSGERPYEFVFLCFDFRYTVVKDRINVYTAVNHLQHPVFCVHIYVNILENDPLR